MVVKSSNSKNGRPYRVVELFSGIGAQHMALERAGLPYEIVGICDIDPYAVQAYEAIHGPAPMLGETTDKNGKRIGDVTRIQHLPKDVDILTYSFPCFVGDTLILTESGEKPIKDVAEGDYVLSHDGEWHRVVRSMKTGTKEVCRFATTFSEGIVCTPEHPVYARRKIGNTFEGPDWVKACDADGWYVGFPVPCYPGFSRGTAQALFESFTGVSLSASGGIIISRVSRDAAHELVRLVAFVFRLPAMIVPHHSGDGYSVYITDNRSEFEGAFYEDGWIWAPFRSEGDGGIEDVYDLEVEDSHSFIANGIVVHNCTDLSQAHLHGKGLKGEHSGLIWAVGDILKQAEIDGRLPRYLIMENVPQVFSKKNRKDWDAWMGFLSTLGYTSQSGLLNAKDFPGTGQNRNRAFMVSHLGDSCPPLPIAPGGDTVLADVLEEDVDERYYLNKSRVKGMERSTSKEKDRGNGFKFKPLEPGSSVSHAITTREGQRKTSNFVRDPTRCQQAGTVEGMRGYESIKRVYSTQGVSPTIVAKKGGNTEAKILEGKSDIRKLTPRETFRLQSFGRRKKNGEWDDSAFEKAAATGLADGRLYGMAGNSINVNVFQSIVEEIDRYDVETDGGRKGQKKLDGWVKNRSAKKKR